MSKIQLSTSGIKTGGRLRPVDADHAQEIIKLVQRGYHVNARDPNSVWSCSLYLYQTKDGSKPFVNSSEGATASLQFRPHKGTEDARLLDEPLPEWMTQLRKHIDRLAPAEWDT